MNVNGGRMFENDKFDRNADFIGLIFFTWLGRVVRSNFYPVVGLDFLVPVVLQGFSSSH